MLINENEIIRNFPQKIALVKKHILGQEVTSVGVFRILPVKKEPWAVGYCLYKILTILLYVFIVALIGHFMTINKLYKWH